MKRNTIYVAVVLSASLLLAGCTNSTQQTVDTQPSGATKNAGQMSKVSYEKEVGLDEEITVKFQMMENSETVPGTASFVFKEFGEKDQMGNTEPIAGQTFYYMEYDFKGDPTNSTTAKPSMFLDPAAPQVVMIDDNTLASIGGAMGGAYNSDYQEEMGLTGYELVTMDQADWMNTATTWYTSKRDNPVVALQYTDMDGNKKYIKINY